MSLFVKKYGGSSLSTPEKIKAVAKNVKELHQNGHQVILVVSAMGKTTNDLTALAYDVAQTPNRRELDMLLSTGERVSMALMSMALNDIGCPAISFTGSQAGVLTDSSHNNAKVIDVKPFRIEKELEARKVVVIAGFQGVDPVSKEITTLGRGGSDLTAVSLAAHFAANACETLKDVDGIFSADPKIVSNAKKIDELSYEALADMTFWGANVLHYRAVELALQNRIPIFVGLSHGMGKGTWIRSSLQGEVMYETEKILSVNSHAKVISILIAKTSSASAIKELEKLLQKNNLPWPQVLHACTVHDSTEIFITGPVELLTAIEKLCAGIAEIKSVKTNFCTVTATCQGAVGSELSLRMSNALEKKNIFARKTFFSAMSVSFLLENKENEEATRVLHQFA